MKEGLPTPVYWSVMVLFLIAAAATLYWIRLYVRDVMIGEELPENREQRDPPSFSHGVVA